MGLFVFKGNMDGQEFKKLVDGFKPTLKKITHKGRYMGFIDSDDLYQESLINLWQRYSLGEFKDKTKSYILKSCYFHIQNYIRTHKVQSGLLSLDEEIARDDEGRNFCLQDTIRDEKTDCFAQLNSRLIVDEIMNNGLTKREKDVFGLFYAGLNLREIAKRLGISHVRVLKIKKNICHKYKARFFE